MKFEKFLHERLLGWDASRRDTRAKTIEKLVEQGLHDGMSREAGTGWNKGWIFYFGALTFIWVVSCTAFAVTESDPHLKSTEDKAMFAVSVFFGLIFIYMFSRAGATIGYLEDFAELGNFKLIKEGIAFFTFVNISQLAWAWWSLSDNAAVTAVQKQLVKLP